jgi:ribonucleoside-diphosphate reductase beta chain
MATAWKSTTAGGLDFDSFPLRLFEKAKRDGIWNPAEIDLEQDRLDWIGLTAVERDLLLRLTALFQAGEEAVTLDLLPLMRSVAREGRIEEEIYLTSFLWEEAKHVELFRRFLDGVADERGDLSHYLSESYRRLVGDELGGALDRLERDPSPVAQAEASVTYNMIVEGVLAETGYHGYFTVLERIGILPGMKQGVALLKRDESRHIAYGVYLLSRLVAEHGEPVWTAIERRFETLLPLALGVVGEAFSAYETVPFDLSADDFLSFATTQFQRRYQRIERARRAGRNEIEREAIAGTEGSDPSV